MKSFSKKSRRRAVIIAAVALLLILLLLALYFFSPKKTALLQPAVALKASQKASLSKGGELTVDMSLTCLGNSIYPAASFSIEFDNDYLELLAIEEGNVFVLDEEGGKKLPVWSVNLEQSNKNGIINLMYLDITGEKNAFTQDLLEAEDNVLLRLKFKLRGSAHEGEVYGIDFADAVFAASDEQDSLALNTQTLIAESGKIVVGD